MFRLSAFVGMAITGVAFLVGTGASQDAKKGEPAPAKAYTPPGWKVLNLSKDQSSKISEIHGNFNGKIKALQDQIAEAKVQEKQEMVKILTADQKKQLLTIVVPEDPPAATDAPKEAPKK